MHLFCPIMGRKLDFWLPFPEDRSVAGLTSSKIAVSGRGTDQFKIRDLFTDDRRNSGFPSTMDVERRVPKATEEEF